MTNPIKGETPTAEELLKEAYEAGMAAQRKIDEINRMLEEGTKQSPAMPSFESWLKREDLNKEKSHLKSQESSVVNEGVISWEDAKRKVADRRGFTSFTFVAGASSIIAIEMYEEAAHLFMEANRQQRWIPVEERLPDMFVKVLITGDEGSIGISSVDTSGELDEYGLMASEFEKITHWQPLPEIPKEVKG